MVDPNTQGNTVPTTSEEDTSSLGTGSDDGGANPCRSQRRSRSKMDVNSIFVGNVDYSTSTTDLSRIFRSCGPIVRVTLPMERCSVPKGYAFIEFERSESVASAIQLTGTIIGGRRIKVAEKRINLPGLSHRRARQRIGEGDGNENEGRSGGARGGGYARGGYNRGGGGGRVYNGNNNNNNGGVYNSRGFRGGASRGGGFRGGDQRGNYGRGMSH